MSKIDTTALIRNEWVQEINEECEYDLDRVKTMLYCLVIYGTTGDRAEAAAAMDQDLVGWGFVKNYFNQIDNMKRESLEKRRENGGRSPAVIQNLSTREQNVLIAKAKKEGQDAATVAEYLYGDAKKSANVRNRLAWKNPDKFI